MGPDFICVWYTVIWSWLNDQIKKEEGEQRRGCKSSFIAGILLFRLIWNGCFEIRARIKIHHEFGVDGAVCRYKYPWSWIQLIIGSSSSSSRCLIIIIFICVIVWFAVFFILAKRFVWSNCSQPDWRIYKRSNR